MKSVLGLIAAISLGGLFAPFARPSNSEKLSERGIEAFHGESYPEAVHAFEEARELRTTAQSTFDLGTTLVADQEHERGEKVLLSLAGDEDLAPSSWYNMGNSRLARGALDDAIESYVEALRLEPSNMSAKRNLEIALRRREEQQSQQDSEGSGGEQDQPEQNEQTPQQEQKQSEELDPDLEQILRSIDQQEREELSRMRRANAIRRPTDW